MQTTFTGKGKTWKKHWLFSSPHTAWVVEWCKPQNLISKQYFQFKKAQVPILKETFSVALTDMNPLARFLDYYSKYYKET